MFSRFTSGQIEYFQQVAYGVVTEMIALHQPGLVLFDGRYYAAELIKPRSVSAQLEKGTKVLIHGIRGSRIVVERDEALYSFA